MLLFKIVDATGGNYGMKYHKGLNENPNGMWFVEGKDLLNYIGYGCMVVIANTESYEKLTKQKFTYEEDGECMYEGGPYIKAYKTKAIFVTDIVPMDEFMVSWTIRLGADITTPADPGVFIKWALNNNYEIFKAIQKRFPDKVNKFVDEWYERNKL